MSSYTCKECGYSHKSPLQFCHVCMVKERDEAKAEAASCGHLWSEERESHDKTKRERDKLQSRIDHIEDFTLTVINGSRDEAFVAHIAELEANLAQAVSSEITASAVVLDLEAQLAERDREIATIIAAIKRSAFDVSPCMECDELTVCLPDGMPICDECGRREEQEQ